MSWQRTVALSAGRAAARGIGTAVSPTPKQVAARTRVDPHWRRLEDGYAARLGTRETIGVTRPVGRWRRVDPRMPQDAWRSAGKGLGLLAWAGAVGAAWWLGSSRGRGPLGMVSELDRLGEAITLPGAGDPPGARR